ncbi:MAG TPA: universal stress protein [Chryseolinea sp.]|nr:universal stress protein [Chryseolinea sp.]HPM30010.1 universal stress protein [Chryseolinea sp.]
MALLFKKIAAAFAFSPTLEGLLTETARVQKYWNSELILIHVGEHSQQEEQQLGELLEKIGLSEYGNLKIVWEKGNPVDRILKTCSREQVDLLIAGALKKESMVKYYLGTIARKILRKADCSVLVLTSPSILPTQIKNIVANTEDTEFIEEVLTTACTIGQKENSNFLHIVREIKMYGLTMSATENCTEEEYAALRQNLVQDEITEVEEILLRIPHEGLKVNVKLLSGKSGFELSQFAQRKNAELLIVGAPQRKFSFFDRLFTHDQEYLFADLPCNLLVINPRKEVSRG